MGENFGVASPSFAFQPHLAQAWATGFGAPHWVQKRPVFSWPQAQVQCSGRLDPQAGQKLPWTVSPQVHCQASSAGFFAPHWGQKLPVAVCPQAQVQLPGAAVPRLLRLLLRAHLEEGLGVHATHLACHILHP